MKQIAITKEKDLRKIGKAGDFPGNGEYILGCDIHVIGGWEGLRASDGFSLRGMGHTVSGLDAPLFASLKGARVENLRVEGEIGKGKGNALLCSEAYASALFGVASMGRVSGQAGLCAYAIGTQFERCINEASVIGEKAGFAGGVCGEALKCSFRSCINSEGVYCAAELGMAAGGICGACSKAFFSGCGNYGRVSSAKGVGGICGDVFWSQIENCANYAAVEGLKQVGGIAGVLRAALIGNSEIVSCFSYGAASAWTGPAGGILGEAKGNLPHPNAVIKCLCCAYSVSSAVGVGRIAGSYAMLGARLKGNQASPMTLLYGQTSAGERYWGSPARMSDPECSLSGSQGENSGSCASLPSFSEKDQIQ